MGDSLMKETLNAMRADKETVHGMRSSFRDWAAKAGFPRDVCELSLAHAVAGKTEKSYWRDDALDPLRTLMQAWGDYCGGSTKEGANLVSMRAVLKLGSDSQK
jgi:integrase